MNNPADAFKASPKRKNYRDLWTQMRAIIAYSSKKRYTREELLKLQDYMERGKISKND